MGGLEPGAPPSPPSCAPRPSRGASRVPSLTRQAPRYVGGLEGPLTPPTLRRGGAGVASALDGGCASATPRSRRSRPSTSRTPARCRGEPDGREEIAERSRRAEGASRRYSCSVVEPGNVLSQRSEGDAALAVTPATPRAGAPGQRMP